MSETDLTQALTGLAADPSAQDRLLARVYGELQRIARSELGRHRRGETLNTGALVHEAYLKLFDRTVISFENRKHFFATAAKAMRQVVIDHARARLADRRGAGAQHTSVDALAAGPLAVEADPEQLLDIDRALTRLATLDERLAQVVELRFFCGLEVAEIAELLGVSEPTVKRDTRAARAFLQRELALGAEPG